MECNVIEGGAGNREDKLVIKEWKVMGWWFVAELEGERRRSWVRKNV